MSGELMVTLCDANHDLIVSLSRCRYRAGSSGGSLVDKSSKAESKSQNLVKSKGIAPGKGQQWPVPGIKKQLHSAINPVKRQMQQK